MSLLVLATFLEPLAKKYNIPFSIILVFLGFFGSEFVTRVLEIDTGIRWDNFHIIIFHILIPSLIFQAALTLDLKTLRKNVIVILILALPMLFIGTILTATVIYYAINHPTGFPWVAALIVGALLSATDPAAVLSVLKNTNTPNRLKNILEGESLFNDATAVVLFSVLVSVATMDVSSGILWEDAFSQFVMVFTGGLMLGLLIGFPAHFILKKFQTTNIQGLVTILIAYGGFIIAEDICHVSGVMAVLSAGIIVRIMYVHNQPERSTIFLHSLWDLLAHISESLLFILAGVTITLSMFSEQWLAILFGIAAVVISRMILIHCLFVFLGLFSESQKLSVRQRNLLVWGGVRGTVTIALALSIPITLDYYYTIQSIAYGVVLFTLIFQATSISILARKL